MARAGDINSKYFHSGIRWRRMENELKWVEVSTVGVRIPVRLTYFL